MKPRVYVAGSSLDMDRARRAVERLRAAGIEVTCTWLDVVSSVGAANLTDATAEQRRSWSVVDLAEVARADVLWFLVPARHAPTRGAWVELGHAYASGKWIVCSGETTKQSIFTALGAEFASDAEAVGFILGMPTVRTKRITVPPMPADVAVTVSDIDDRFDHGGDR